MGMFKLLEFLFKIPDTNFPTTLFTTPRSIKASSDPVPPLPLPERPRLRLLVSRFSTPPLLLALLAPFVSDAPANKKCILLYIYSVNRVCVKKDIKIYYLTLKKNETCFRLFLDLEEET